jgi:lipoate-protein ligase A
MGRQLALAEGMLAGVAATGVPAFRWYVPAQPALVLGNGQAPSLPNLAACRAHGVRPYRRTSGGTAVVVDAGLLSLDLALPATHALNTSDVVRAYQWLGETWERALHELGIVKARALPTEEVRAIPPLAKDDPLRLSCYGTLSPWEVVIGKRKIVGLCQVRRKAGALYQVGVYLHFDPKALGELLDLNNNQRKVLGTRLHNAAVGLDVAGGRAYTRDEVIAAFENALAPLPGLHLASAQWLPAEREAAKRIERERFQPLG